MTVPQPLAKEDVMLLDVTGTSLGIECVDLDKLKSAVAGLREELIEKVTQKIREEDNRDIRTIIDKTIDTWLGNALTEEKDGKTPNN